MITTLVSLTLITLLAYAVKAATGFGPALVVVSLGSMLVGPAHAVILAAFLDMASGAGLLWLDRGRIAAEAWRGLAVTMAAGAVVGAMLLGVIPTATLTRVVAVGIVAFGVWMLATPTMGGSTDESTRPGAEPRDDRRERAGFSAHLMAAIGGLSGGLIGVGGPPLVIYFGARLPRERFRALIVPLLLTAAVFRVATYALTGQVDRELMMLVLPSLPALPLGLALGNRLFRRWSDRGFRIAVSLLVTLAGLRLLF